MNFIKKTIILLIYLFLLNSFIRVNTNAQSPTWSEPLLLSSQEWSSLFPVMVSDNMGQLHVFWRERTGAPEWKNNPDTTIYYRRWDGSTWLRSIDVFVAPSPGGVVRILSATVDHRGRLHVIWSGAQQFSEDLYHSWAWVQEPIDARSWTTSLIDNGINITYADLTIDANDNLHLVYNEAHEHIYYVTSSAEEQISNWSTPTDLSISAVVEGPQITVSHDGWIHVTWTEMTTEGFGQAIYYTRSQDGLTWEPPYAIYNPGTDEKGGHLAHWATISVDNDNRLHLVWSRGVGRSDGRYYSYSEDNGNTWSLPIVIQEGFSGSTGFAAMDIDSNDVLHLIISARSSEFGGTMLFHSTWNEETRKWGQLLSVTDPYEKKYFFSEHPSMTITNGNKINLAWMRWDIPAPILYSTRTLLKTPSQTSVNYPEIKPIPTSTPQTNHIIQNKESSPTPQQDSKAMDDQQSIQIGNMAMIAISVTPVFILIAIVLLVKRKQQK